MPELPDVELYKKRLDATVLGRTVADVDVRDKRLLRETTPKALREGLGGRRIESSRRHGKHLFLGLDDGTWLALHFGMTGDVELFDDPAADPAYDQIRFDFTDGKHLAYISRRRLGRVGLVADPDDFLRVEGAGPDALDPAFDLDAFAEGLARKRGDVKAALMDQKMVAGIGNVYSDEILFQAGIHPATKVPALDAAARARLFRSLRRVLQRAVESGAHAERDPENLPADFLIPRRVKGGRCPRCDTALKTLKAGGRTGYYCPRCQREAAVPD